MRLPLAVPLSAVPLLAVLALVDTAARAAEQARSVPTFNAVSNNGEIGIAIEAGKAQSVVAHGNATFLNALTTQVVDGELRIDLIDKSVASTLDHPKVVITLPALTHFSMSGAGAATLAGLAGDRLDVRFAGAGSLKADGTVSLLTLELEGVGSVDASALHAETAVVKVGGVGSVKVYASTHLEATVGGIGSLTYYGDPKTVDTRGAGLGRIRPGR